MLLTTSLMPQCSHPFSSPPLQLSSFWIIISSSIANDIQASQLIVHSLALMIVIKDADSAHPPYYSVKRLSVALEDYLSSWSFPLFFDILQAYMQLTNANDIDVATRSGCARSWLTALQCSQRAERQSQTVPAHEGASLHDASMQASAVGPLILRQCHSSSSIKHTG